MKELKLLFAQAAVAEVYKVNSMFLEVKKEKNTFLKNAIRFLI
jgi:hypothetical protein